MPTSNLLRKILQIPKKKNNNEIINSTTINKTINNKIKNVKTHYIYIFMDDIEIKKLFNDYSVNTGNNIKIEKNGTIINFDIKKITRISNDNENKLINNKSKKIEEIKEILRGINDNVIIYIKPLKLKSNSINKTKVDYIFLKKRENNSENKLKSGKYFLKSLSFRGKTNSENDLKNTNFENDLKNKIKYFTSDDIFSEIVKIINPLSNNSNIHKNNNVNYFSNLTNIESVNSNLTNIKSVNSNLTNIKSVNSNLTNIESVNSNLTNIESVNSNLTNIESVKSNISNVNFYTNDKLNYKQKIKYYYILGLGCSKNKDKKNIYEGFFSELFKKTKDKIDLKIICKSYHKAIFTIGKRLIGKPPSNSQYLLNIQNNILNDLKIYDEVIVCGHSYGGSLISRIAKNLNKNGIKYNNLKMYTVGSIYIPQKELENINIIHFMNFSDISLRLSTTNYNKLKKNFKEKLKNIILPFEFGEIKSMKYFMSNNKQIFYININSNNNKSLLSRITPTELKKHNDYGYIQYCILNSEKFRSDLSSIIDRVKLTEISKQ